MLFRSDPEILEMRYPVVVEESSIRKGSGGKGLYNGGDGTTRRMRFLEDMTCAMIGSSRYNSPRGLNGGGDGECGKTEIRRLSAPSNCSITAIRLRCLLARRSSSPRLPPVVTAKPTEQYLLSGLLSGILSLT